MTKRKQLTKHLKVSLYFLSKEENGRTEPIPVGIDEVSFRPLLRYDNSNHVCIVFSLEKEWLNPGETCELFISLLTPENHIGKLTERKEIELFENRLIAKGKVIQILDL